MDLSMADLLICGSQHSISNYRRNDLLGSSTSMSLDCFTHGANNTSGPTGNLRQEPPVEDDGCTLVLGLGPTPSFYRNNCNGYRGAPEPKGPCTEDNLLPTLGNEVIDPGILQLGIPAGTEEQHNSNVNSQNFLESLLPSNSGGGLFPPTSDEGSTSSRRNGGYMPSLLLAPRSEGTESPNTTEHGGDPLVAASRDTAEHYPQASLEPSVTTTTTDCSVDAATCDTAARHHHPKKCRFKGCHKGARGASGLCIAHGGGQRCQKPGCNKGAESRTAFCKAHGGGRRCQELGCTKSAEGKTDYCIAHGGGRRCGHPSCGKAARGKSGLCIRHGGGKRCSVDGCARSAEGQAGLCISHGGGRRCQYPDCCKGAQGSTMYCKAHGGGKRCVFDGCTKGAEGSTPLCKGHGGGKRCLFEGGGVCPKSVHGGTSFCVAHGGGKRCAIAGCTKSARGRTDYCVKHGGGKRCRFEGCSKSAQGSTDFCKAHGGGKRCTWAQGCEKFARGKSGLCAAHGSLMLAQKQQQDMRSGGGGGRNSNSSMIRPNLFRGLVSTSTTVCGSSMDNHSYSSSSLSTSSGSAPGPWATAVGSAGSLMIPSQVLVPPSMKSPPTLSGVAGAEVSRGNISSGGRSSHSHSHSRSAAGIVVPEGRVHGGGLLSLLGGNFHNVDIGGE